MPVLTRIGSCAEKVKGWRWHLRMHPELAIDCHETENWIVERLHEIGVDEIHRGIDKTGIVALITGRRVGPVIGLRATPGSLAFCASQSR